LSHVFGGERQDHPTRLPQAQSPSRGWSWAAIAEGRALGVAALEIRVTGGFSRCGCSRLTPFIGFLLLATV
jgi:hypothetical protein